MAGAGTKTPLVLNLMCYLGEMNEEKFASLVAQGAKPVDAVKQVYPESNTPRALANHLMRSPIVEDYFKQLRDYAIKSEEIKPEHVLGQLLRIAMTSEKDSDRLSALRMLGEHVGMHNSYSSASQIVEAFSKAFGAELGKQVAEKLGVDTAD